MSPEEARAELAATLDVSRETMARLDLYADLLRRWTKRINLVSRASLDGLWRRHMLDSAQLLPHLPAQARSLIDIGSGAGFPGLVLAILRPALRVHLIEANQRKAAFLREVARATGTEITLHARRAEQVAPFAADVITARALAPLAPLLHIAAPFQGPDTVYLLLKGQDVENELILAAKCWTMTVARAPSLSDPSGVVLQLREVIRA